MKPENKPTKVEKINCSFCGELMAKLYPNHTFTVNGNGKFLCKKCREKKVL